MFPLWKSPCQFKSFKPAELKGHLTSIHPKNALDSVESLRCKKARFEKGGTLPMFGFIKTQKPCLEALYEVAPHIVTLLKLLALL